MYKTSKPAIDTVIENILVKPQHLNDSKHKIANFNYLFLNNNCNVSSRIHGTNVELPMVIADNRKFRYY